MTSETIFIFFMSIVLMWIKPGPGQALRVTTAFNDGFLPAIAIAIGVTIICNFYLLIAIFGSTLIANIFNGVGFYFKLFGAAYLFYLGIKGFINIKNKKPNNYSIKRKFLQNIGIGFLMALSNPITIFYFVGILPSLIDVTNLKLTDVLILLIIMNISALVIDSLILVLATQSKTAFTNEKSKKIVNIISSIGFILIALYLLYTAFFSSEFTYSLL